MQPTISWESGLWKNKLYHFASEYCIIYIYFPLLLHICLDAGHSTHFQVGGDNPKVERGSWKTSMENKAVFYVHFDIFIFENKEAWEKNTIRRTICPVPGCCGMPWSWYHFHISLLRTSNNLIQDIFFFSFKEFGFIL